MFKTIFQNHFFKITCLILVLHLSACKKDGDNPSPSGTKDDYFPTTTGTKWSYSGTIAGKKYTVVAQVNGNEKTFNGKVYREIEGTANGLSSKSYVLKENGNYYFRGQMISNGVVTDNNLELNELKDNVPVNTEWHDDIKETLNGINFITRYTSKILAKDISYAVNNKNYNNVIKVELTTSVIIDDSEPIIMARQYDYFAKGIGYIQTDLGDYGTYNLDSYEIK